MIGNDIEIAQVNVKELIPSEYNPRSASEKECQDLKASILAFGLVDPIIVNSAVNRKNIVIGGHFRLRMAIELGFDTVPVVYLNIPELVKEQELNLRLNKNSGQWDFDLLANFDEELLKGVGFESKELDFIFQLDEPEANEAPDLRPATDIVVGDLYQLGQHRLQCGDATKREDVERLMGGEKADMVFTDPPYGVDYDGTHLSSGTYFGKGQREKEKLASDDCDIYAEIMPVIFDILKDDKVSVYLCFAGARGLEVYNAVALANFTVRALIIWNKNHAQFGSMGSQYKQKHEPILYLYKKGKSTQWFGANNEVTVWDIDRESKNTYHLTQKPPALSERAIMNSSARNDVVVDIFGGSGSTLIACEKLNRKCRMMEIDPIYCQVIIDRWEKFTGYKAVKIEVPVA